VDIKDWFSQPLYSNGKKALPPPSRPTQAAQRKDAPPPKPLLNPKTIRYRVLNPEGQLQAVHVRIDGVDQDTGKPAKRMWWELPDGTKGLGALKTPDLPLYGSQLLSNHPDEEMPIVVEGEKAAQALIRRGLPAVGTVCGAAARPAEEALRPLVRFASVTLWPDADETGIKHMQSVARVLRGLGVQDIRVVDVDRRPKGEDAADFPDDSDIRPMLDAAKPWVEQAGSLTKAGETSDVPALIIPWETRDLAEIANEAYLRRTAIVDRLLYSSSVSMVTGGKHAGKSTLTRYLAICIAKGREFLDREVTGGPVYYIASEDETMAARQELIRLGWDANDRLRFVSSSNVSTDGDELIAFLMALTEEMRRESATLVVLDMLFDFVRIRDEMGYAETRSALGDIQRVATGSGAHVCVVHHAPKHATYTAEAAVTALGSQGLAARVSPIVLVRRHGPGVHSVVSTEVRDPRGKAIAQSKLVLEPDGSMRLGGAWQDWMQADVYKPQILEILGAEDGQELTANQLVDQLDTVSYRTVASALSQLYKEGQIGRSGSGKKGQPYRYALYAVSDPQAARGRPVERAELNLPAEPDQSRLEN
jgi:DNA-binding transcriptional ArsR family regulator